MAQGGIFDSSESVTFPDVADDPTVSPRPTGAPTTSGAPTTTDRPSLAPTPCQKSNVKVAITTDDHPDETSWALFNQSFETVASGEEYQLPGTLYEHLHCLPDEVYTFVIFDEAGNGLCCGGGYEIFFDDVLMA